jgi:hypothetical protein
MDGLMVLVALVGGLLVFDALALRFGADSRESMGDDWARPSAN